jgi:hypothetical protein
MTTFKKLQIIQSQSVFSKSCYEVCIPLDNIKTFIKRYSFPDSKTPIELLDNKEFISLIIPDFQRNNDKWNQKMQIKFLENIVCGCMSTFIMGKIIKKPEEKGIFSNCKLIDGQQRLTAILSYMNKDFPIFGDIYYNQDVNSFFSSLWSLKLKIYEFDSEKEMVQFYIDLNENITHSLDDINRAYKYLKKLER